MNNGKAILVPFICLFMFSATIIPILLINPSYEIQENTHDWHQTNETYYPLFPQPRLIEEQEENEKIGNDNLDKKYVLINNGDTESEIKAKLGESVSVSNYTMRSFWRVVGPVPNIPNGTNYRQLTYDGGLYWIWVWLVSPGDYENITGEITLSNEWIVVDKGFGDKNAVYY